MHGAARAGSVDFPPLWKFEDASLAPLTRSPRSNTTAGALVSSSGRYRIELCDGWTGCSDGSEYIGFNNKTCSAGVPPVSKTYGDTVGPLLRSSGVSKNWRTWTVDVVKKMTDRSIVTIKNDFSEAKCTKHYIDDYSEKKDACKGTVWADRVHLHKFPGQWTVKPAKGTDGKCFNIINHEKAARMPQVPERQLGLQGAPPEARREGRRKRPAAVEVCQGRRLAVALRPRRSREARACLLGPTIARHAASPSLRRWTARSSMTSPASTRTITRSAVLSRFPPRRPTSRQSYRRRR